MRTTGCQAQAELALSFGPRDDAGSLGDHARAVESSHGYGARDAYVDRSSESYAARQPPPSNARPDYPTPAGAHNQFGIPPSSSASSTATHGGTGQQGVYHGGTSRSRHSATQPSPYDGHPHRKIPRETFTEDLATNADIAVTVRE